MILLLGIVVVMSRLIADIRVMIVMVITHRHHENNGIQRNQNHDGDFKRF